MGELLAFRNPTNPFHLFEEMERDWERLFDTYAPTWDFIDKEDEYLITMDVPGVPKDALSIELRNGNLYVSGERSRQGKSRRKFERVVKVPETVDTDRIDANLEDGVLTILLPKTEKAKSRKIAIGTGKRGIWDRLLGRDEKPAEKPAVEAEATALS